ncbi:MAG: hypothetical protein MK289_06060 [Trichodesmium sp. ALOHA_ZT_67]|nr:hypothetical protein [Trichodesmium sp. ALOHA_ZT_67]
MGFNSNETSAKEAKTEAWNYLTAKCDGVDSEMIQQIIKNTPIKRWYFSTEICQIIAFLCYPKAAFIKEEVA